MSEEVILKQIVVPVIVDLLKRKAVEADNKMVVDVIDTLSDPDKREAALVELANDSELKQNFISGLADAVEGTLGGVLDVLFLPFSIFKKK